MFDEPGFSYIPPPASLCWSGESASEQTRSTCPASSTPEGAFGMRGLPDNVEEWTARSFRKDYATPATDQYRVLRGGSWATNAQWAMRGARRHGEVPNYAGQLIGFRCAR